MNDMDRLLRNAQQVHVALYYYTKYEGKIANVYFFQNHRDSEQKIPKIETHEFMTALPLMDATSSKVQCKLWSM